MSVSNEIFGSTASCAGDKVVSIRLTELDRETTTQRTLLTPAAVNTAAHTVKAFI